MIGLGLGLGRARRLDPGAGGADTVAPVLSGLIVNAPANQFDFTCTELGALHWLIDATPSFADAQALVAAKPAGAASGTGLATAGANTTGFDPSGVPDGTWRLHVGVIDGASNASNVLSADLTVTTAGIQWNGDAVEWNGDQLIFNAA